jgi:hypothetical protein
LFKDEIDRKKFQLKIKGATRDSLKKLSKVKLTIRQENIILAAQKNTFSYLHKNQHRISKADLNIKD